MNRLQAGYNRIAREIDKPGRLIGKYFIRVLDEFNRVAIRVPHPDALEIGNCSEHGARRGGLRFDLQENCVPARM